WVCFLNLLPDNGKLQFLLWLKANLYQSWSYCLQGARYSRHIFFCGGYISNLFLQLHFFIIFFLSIYTSQTTKPKPLQLKMRFLIPRCSIRLRERNRQKVVYTIWQKVMPTWLR